MARKLAGGLLGADYQHKAKDILSQRFIVPPFSVLNTREGAWQERKRAWISIGIQSELGRGADNGGSKQHMMVGKGGVDLKTYYNKPPAPGGGGPNSAYRNLKKDEEGVSDGGVSIFDPVLCELAYRWFCPPGGLVFDPFAGGSVRGIVAGELGLEYFGIDLSAAQLKANEAQAKAIGTTPVPTWINGDSRECRDLIDGEGAFDFMFSCPPYGNLEVYSNNPQDLSAMDDGDFDDAYGFVIQQAAELLKHGAFACFVVGDYRDKHGFYRNLIGITVDAFAGAGMHLYNTAILLNATGSLPLRVQNQFNGSRKLGTCHQTVLVFAKGQPKDFVKGWQPWHAV